MANSGYNKIQRDKEQFVKEIVQYQYTNNQDVFVIYGAGKYGQNLYRLLKEHHIPIKCFCVSDVVFNKDMIENVPVMKISSLLEFGSRILFLIASKPPANQSMIDELKKFGFEKYINLPENFDKMMDDVFFRPVLEITPKAGCSIHCRYCPQDLFLQRYYDCSSISEMSFDTFKQCIDKTPSNLMIDFSGFVEPFLAKDAIQMMQYANHIGRDMRLFTTLVGLNLSDFEKIRDIPFKQVVLHLPDEEGYANILINKEYLELLRCIMDTHKPDGSPFVDSANCQTKPNPKVLEIVNNKVRVSWDLYDRAGNLEGDNLQSTDIRKGELYCDRALNIDHNVLLPNGDVVLCCMDFGMEYVLGNLIKQDYEDIINGYPMQRVKEMMQDKQDLSLICRKCIFGMNKI